MSAPTVQGQFLPTQEELVNIYKRCIQAGAARRGLTVNVLPGSEYDDRARACARIAAAAFANHKLSVAALNPLDATGSYLEELCQVFGVPKYGPSKSIGTVAVRVVGVSTVTIPAGFRGSTDDGEKYEVRESKAVANGEMVDIVAVNGGESTNQPAGTVFTWDSASIAKLRREAAVGPGGLTEGRDGDTEERLRARLLARLAAPGVGGNWSMIQQLAESSSSAISAAYVYPSIQGPGSYGVAVVSTEPDREVSTAVVNAAAQAITAAMPGHAKLNMTTVSAQYVDIVVKLRLQLPVQAGGKGGGWRDGVPWPNATSGPVKITAFNATTGEITTDATALNGLTVGMHLAIWDYANAGNDESAGEASPVFEFTVATAAVSGGFVKITAVSGFSKSYVNAYLSAGAERIKNYLISFYDQMVALGPGEKTSNVWILPRGYRKPTADVSGPSDLTSQLLLALPDAYPEIMNIDWVARYSTGTTTPKTAPSIPTAITDPPKILALRHMAFVHGA